MARDLGKGFTVGTVQIPGVCEHCGIPLERGERVAMWNPTMELFCLRCAKAGVRPEEPLSYDLLIPALTALLLMFAIILGLVK